MKQTQEDYIPTERIALVVFWLVQGSQLTTGDIARLAGISQQGAWSMMQKICRVLPLYQENGLWIFEHKE